jgi:hypothetical protein
VLKFGAIERRPEQVGLRVHQDLFETLDNSRDVVAGETRSRQHATMKRLNVIAIFVAVPGRVVRGSPKT